MTIAGYAGEAMEPFLSRDGRTLFFNNRNDPGVQTDLHWAVRTGPAAFRYRGPVAGANSAALDGVPTLAGERFCFISTRSYERTLGTVYCGQWRDGRAANVTLQRAAGPRVRGEVVFDVELAADGATLVLAQGRFDGGAVPSTGDLRLARRQPGGFALDAAADATFAAVNTRALEYAAALSADGRTLAFTRVGGWGPFARPRIWLARRAGPAGAFGAPVQLPGLGDFVEAASFAPDGRSFIYHRRVNGRFELWQARL